MNAPDLETYEVEKYDGYPMKGLFWATVFSIPIWALIVWIIWRVL